MNHLFFLIVKRFHLKGFAGSRVRGLASHQYVACVALAPHQRRCLVSVVHHLNPGFAVNQELDRDLNRGVKETQESCLGMMLSDDLSL